MGGVGPDDGSTYSPRIAFIYIFNLIVGTGALALPSVLTLGGWVLGTLFLGVVAASSYIAVTFMIESMAAANAMVALNSSGPEQTELLSLTAYEGGEEYERDEAEAVVTTSASTSMSTGGGMVISRSGDSLSSCPSPSKADPALAPGGVSSPPLPSLHLGPNALGSPVTLRSQANLFEITQRTELGQMADLFFSHTGRIFFYIALICYLYGDATIYCTFIPRSLVGFIYGKSPPPWAFDLFLLAFVCVIVPFCFFDFQKTKPLQMVTMVIRNLALFTMILLATWLITTQGPRAKGVPNFNVKALPNLFGGAVYAFMCHHSLPGIITPMRNKVWVSFVLKSAFASVFAIYLLLFVSCGLAFGLSAEDPITFNFLPSKFGLIGDFLFLFPVFTLSSNYPMLTITLRNNLDTLLHLLLPRGNLVLPPVAAFSPRPLKRTSDMGVGLPPSPGGPHPHHLRTASRSRQLVVTFIAVGPPILCCLLAEHLGVDVDTLVGLIGAYAGAAVMLVIPACLVYCSRLVVNQEVVGGSGSKGSVNVMGVQFGPVSSPHQANMHASPFRSPLWVIALIVLAIFAIGFITFNQVMEAGFH